MDELVKVISKLLTNLIYEGVKRVEADSGDYEIVAYRMGQFQYRIDIKEVHKTS